MVARGGIHHHVKLTRFRSGSGISDRSRLHVQPLSGGEECPGSHSNSVSCLRTAVLGHQRVSEGQSQRIAAQCVSHEEQIANVVQGILCRWWVRLSFLRPHGSEAFTMKEADFRFPDTQISGSHGWRKWLFVGVSIITSSSFVFGQVQESLADQGYASYPFSEGRNAREAAELCILPAYSRTGTSESE